MCGNGETCILATSIPTLSKEFTSGKLTKVSRKKKEYNRRRWSQILVDGTSGGHGRDRCKSWLLEAVRNR